MVGDTVINPGRSGIQTVVRSLAAAFGTLRLPVRPVVWNARYGQLRPLPPEASLGLAAEALRDPPGVPLSLLWHPALWWPWLLKRGHPNWIPLHLHPDYVDLPRGTWVLMPELIYRDRAAAFIRYIHDRGWRVALIFHDAIPVQFPEYVPPELPENHAGYMRAFAGADLILPTSSATAEGWLAFMEKEGLTSPPVRVCRLACDIPGVPRTLASEDGSKAGAGLPAPCPQAVRMLCVSTLEPRKNHAALLAAFELAVAARPDLPLELDLVGARYVDRGDIVEAVQAVVARHPGRVRWREHVSHAVLHGLYRECDFTVYPSVLEGFGLPVIESLWQGRPCVCANFSVMAENAAGGGCLTCDVRDPRALADTILRLADSPDLRRKLAAEATSRPLKTWREYALEVIDAMKDAGGNQKVHREHGGVDTQAEEKGKKPGSRKRRLPSLPVTNQQ